MGANKSTATTTPTDIDASKILLMVSGYLRIEEYENEMEIPHDIQNIIILYNIKQAIYGIGIKLEEAFGFSKCGWNQLTSLNNIDIQNIYKNYSSFTIITSNHQIIACGDMFGYQRKITNVTELTGINGILSSQNSTSVSFILDENANLFQHLPYKNELMKLTYTFPQNHERIVAIKCGFHSIWILTNLHQLYQTSQPYIRKHHALGDLQPIGENIIDFDVGYHFAVLIDKYSELVILTKYDCPAAINENKTVIQQYFKQNQIKIDKVRCGLLNCLCIDKDGNCYTFGNWLNDNLSGIGNANPFKIPLSDNNYVIKADCGYFHSLLLTKNNDVIVFGYNVDPYTKCCVISTELNDQEWIQSPHVLNREKELCVSNDSYIDDVLAFDCHSLIFVNPIRKRKN